MNLADFMLNLAKDPKALAQFQENPQSAMTQAGLSSNEIAAVTSKSAVAIHNAIVGAAGAKGSGAHIVVVVVLAK